jgi:hypothetical protein
MDEKLQEIHNRYEIPEPDAIENPMEKQIGQEIDALGITPALMRDISFYRSRKVEVEYLEDPEVIKELIAMNERLKNVDS